MSERNSQGSEEWFRIIAENLKDRLLGIELDDNTGKQVSPPCQVMFFVPWNWIRISLPPQVRGAPGYRGPYMFFRGNNKRVAAVIFDFYPPLVAPSKEVLEKIAREFGLNIREDEYWSNDYFGLYSEKLFE